MATSAVQETNGAKSRALGTDISDLSGKVALITGASSGLGRAIAEAYAATGAFVVSADLTPDPPEGLLRAGAKEQPEAKRSSSTVDLLNQEFPAHGSLPRAIFVRCNVTDAASMQAAVTATVQQYGRLDIMVNNAGTCSVLKTAMYRNGGLCRLHEVEDEVFDKDMAINARGVWLGTKYACAQMLSQTPHASGDRGWIINMSSVSGLVGSYGIAPYCASKGACLLLTKAAALDYANDRIHVNCIAPGFVDTPLINPIMSAVGPAQVEAHTTKMGNLHPWGRLARPEEIARMAVFLAGPGASFCTGQAFVVDGGMTTQ